MCNNSGLISRISAIIGLVAIIALFLFFPSTTTAVHEGNLLDSAGSGGTSIRRLNEGNSKKVGTRFDVPSNTTWFVTSISMRMVRDDPAGEGPWTGQAYKFSVYLSGGTTALCSTASGNSAELPDISDGDTVVELSFSEPCEIPTGNYLAVLECNTGNCADTADSVYTVGRRNATSGAPTTQRFDTTWTTITPGAQHVIYGWENFIPPPTPTPAPTSTPIPTPTPTPHAVTPVTIADPNATFNDCISSVEAGENRWFYQPFIPDITGQINSITLRLRKIGNPDSLLNVLILDVPESGTPTTDKTLAQGFFNPQSIGFATVSRDITVSPNPTVIQGERYAILLAYIDANPTANHLCYAVETDADYESPWQVTGPDFNNFSPFASSVTIDFVVNGFTSESGYVPSNPAENEPAPSPGASYSAYAWSWTNGYIGQPLFYDFSTVTSDTTLVLRRLSENGNPVSNIASYVVSSTIPYFIHQTHGMTSGPFEVFDATNNRRLIKHFVLPEPSASFKDNRSHREAADFAVGHGPIVYRSINVGSFIEHLHNYNNPIDSMVAFGGYTFLHYRIPTASDPDDIFLAIHDAEKQIEVAKIPIAQLANYIGINQTFSEVFSPVPAHPYYQSFIVLNTSGNNLPFVQNFELLSFVGATLERGVYNYALVDVDNVVLSEGESVLIVTPTIQNPWKLSAQNSQYALNQNVVFRFTNADSALFRTYNNFAFISCFGEIDIGVDNEYRATQNLSYTTPDILTASFPLPCNNVLHIAPILLPFAIDTSVYRFDVTSLYTLHETLGLFDRLTFCKTESDKALCAFGLIVGIGTLALWLPVAIVIPLEIFAIAFLAWQEFIPREIIMIGGAFLGMIVILVMFLRRSPEGA